VEESFNAQAVHSSHFIQWRCPPVEDSSLHTIHREVSAQIIFSEGAHLWRTVLFTGRSQLTFYSVKVPTCGGQF
jgi:hypothetical protein